MVAKKKTSTKKTVSTAKIFTYSGKTYYKNKFDAEKRRRVGERIYYDTTLKAYYIRRPKSNSLF